MLSAILFHLNISTPPAIFAMASKCCLSREALPRPSASSALAFSSATYVTVVASINFEAPLLEHLIERFLFRNVRFGVRQFPDLGVCFFAEKVAHVRAYPVCRRLEPAFNFEQSLVRIDDTPANQNDCIKGYVVFALGFLYLGDVDVVLYKDVVDGLVAVVELFLDVVRVF